MAFSNSDLLEPIITAIYGYENAQNRKILLRFGETNLSHFSRFVSNIPAERLSSAKRRSPTGRTCHRPCSILLHGLRRWRSRPFAAAQPSALSRYLSIDGRTAASLEAARDSRWMYLFHPQSTMPHVIHLLQSPPCPACPRWYFLLVDSKCSTPVTTPSFIEIINSPQVVF